MPYFTVEVAETRKVFVEYLIEAPDSHVAFSLAETGETVSSRDIRTIEVTHRKTLASPTIRFTNHEITVLGVEPYSLIVTDHIHNYGLVETSAEIADLTQAEANTLVDFFETKYDCSADWVGEPT